MNGRNDGKTHSEGPRGATVAPRTTPIVGQLITGRVP